MSRMTDLDIVRNRPVAEFYYVGNHSHPVRRKILIRKVTPKLIIGYELREGSTARTPRQALGVTKAYRRDRIAKWGDYSRLTASAKNADKNPAASTLERKPLESLIWEGV